MKRTREFINKIRRQFQSKEAVPEDFNEGKQPVKVGQGENKVGKSEDSDKFSFLNAGKKSLKERPVSQEENGNDSFEEAEFVELNEHTIRIDNSNKPGKSPDLNINEVSFIKEAQKKLADIQKLDSKKNRKEKFEAIHKLSSEIDKMKKEHPFSVSEILALDTILDELDNMNQLL